MLSPVVTDIGTELSVHMDMIMPNIPFSLLTAYQILAIDGIGDVLLCSSNHLHHVCTNGSAHLGIISQYGIPNGEIIAATQSSSICNAGCYAIMPMSIF